MNPVLPSHRQLALPLLKVLQRHGPLAPKAAADRVAQDLGLPGEVREARRPMPGYSRDGVNLFERRLRWVRQSHFRQGLIGNLERSRWSLTDLGDKFAKEAAPGVVLTIFETDNGSALWAEFQTAMGFLEDGCVNTCVTSLPYPIVGGRAYGTFTPEQCVNMADELFRGLKRVLADDGSVFLNLADAWNSGQPTRSLYQEKILLKLVEEQGYHLADRFVWHNPSALARSPWVTQRRERVRSAFEHFYWLSPSAHPKADNRQVLVPYGATMRRVLAKGGENRAERPSGQGSGHPNGSYRNDNGGAIPSNVFTVAHATSNNAYQANCRRLRLPIHPARFPEDGKMLDFLVKLTTAPGDLVADFCAGSQMLPAVAERLGRRWVSVEKDLTYIRGGEARLRGAAGFHSYGIPGELRPVLPLP